MSARLRLGGTFDFDNQLDRLNQIKQDLEDPSVWEDPSKAESMGRERARLEAVLVPLESVGSGLAGAVLRHTRYAVYKLRAGRSRRRRRHMALSFWTRRPG